MSRLAERLPDLRRRLDEAVAGSLVPGAAVAVLHDGEMLEAASGVTSTATGVAADPATLFQIGSITKVYTAALVTRLAAGGVIDLDAPVAQLLPGFRVADRVASATITPRHLLTHTAGFDGGDHFEDDGRGDDCVARYVEGLVRLGQLTPPGDVWSYCNAGYVALGRLVEHVTGTVWDRALRELLLDPAGLARTVTLPEEAIVHRVATGHTITAELATRAVSTWVLPRSIGPAGLITATAGDLARFGALHCDPVPAAPGPDPVIPVVVRDAMQHADVPIPGRPGARAGLGWVVQECDGEVVLSHDGGTNGQLAFLRVLPRRRLVFALVTNCFTGTLVFRALQPAVFAALDLPPPPDPYPASTGAPVDPARWVGCYERRGARLEIAETPDGLDLRPDVYGVPVELPPIPSVPLRAVDASTLVAVGPDGSPIGALVSLDRDRSGRTRLLHALGRVARREE